MEKTKGYLFRLELSYLHESYFKAKEEKEKEKEISPSMTFPVSVQYHPQYTYIPSTGLRLGSTLGSTLGSLDFPNPYWTTTTATISDPTYTYLNSGPTINGYLKKYDQSNPYFVVSLRKSGEDVARIAMEELIPKHKAEEAHFEITKIEFVGEVLIPDITKLNKSLLEI